MNHLKITVVIDQNERINQKVADRLVGLIDKEIDKMENEGLITDGESSLHWRFTKRRVVKNDPVSRDLGGKR